uniref:Protein phosphatase inhibitor 2 n=1 Tax=Anopheles marajoara TaxID=58244 RepID=A0A2M4BXW2_9DIPT
MSFSADLPEAKKPCKGILKSSSSFDKHSTSAATSAHRKSAKFDELNVLQTHHPPDKDYGHMKVDEPKTPYNYVEQDDVDQLDAELLVERLRVAANTRTESFSEEEESEEEEEELSEEQKKRKLEFERRRKLHYNEFEAVKAARKLIEEEEDDDDDDDDDNGDDKETTSGVTKRTDSRVADGSSSTAGAGPSASSQEEDTHMEVEEQDDVDRNGGGGGGGSGSGPQATSNFFTPSDSLAPRLKPGTEDLV